jgi:tripartite ATP-independent transporter DctM subunit
MPVAFAFALIGGLGVYLLKGAGPALSLIGGAPFEWASNGGLLAVPLFILMGQFVYQSGISTELYAAAHKWVGRFSGGLALATTLASTAFGACCGVSMAGCATFGTIAFPEMEEYHYSRRLSTGCIAAGGSLSSLIPPSAPFIIYGVFTYTSIGKLFIAGIFPGLLLSGLYLSIIYVMCKRNPDLGPPGPAYRWGETLRSLSGVLGVLVLFILVMGGLFVGVLNPSEAGSICAFGALIKRKLTFSGLVASLKDAIMTTCMIIMIATGAMIFAKFLAIAGFSSMFGGWVMTLPLSRDAIMIIIFMIYVILGMFMDVLAMILLTLPIVFPIIVNLGFDPIWFGVVLTLLGEMGNLTPPVGMNVFVVSGVTKVPLEEVFRGITPFFLAIVACLILLYVFPSIILYLPGVMK